MTCQNTTMTNRDARIVGVDFNGVLDRKPAAHVFVDDRAMCFRGDFDETLKQIDAFVAHWEG